MRIAIFTNYGGNHIPRHIYEAVSKSPKFYRVALAEELDKLPANCDELTQEIYDDFLDNKKMDYLKSKSNNYIYCRSYRDNILVSKIEFIEVDTSKPWRILNEDGVESIEYFNGLTILNEFNEANW